MIMCGEGPARPLAAIDPEAVLLLAALVLTATSRQYAARSGGANSPRTHQGQRLGRGHRAQERRKNRAAGEDTKAAASAQVGSAG